MGIMLGRIKMHMLNIEHNNNFPACFNPELLPILTCAQILFFDEIHIEQEEAPLLTTEC